MLSEVPLGLAVEHLDVKEGAANQKTAKFVLKNLSKAKKLHVSLLYIMQNGQQEKHLVCIWL